MQICNKCHIEKPLSQYHKHAAFALGVRKICRECCCAATREWYQRNRESHIKTCQNYQKEHPEIAKKCNKNYADKKKKWQKKHVEPNSKKEMAKIITKYLVFKGEIEKPTYCQICSEKHSTLEAHHHDLSKPKSIVWLCKSCTTWINKKNETKIDGKKTA